jgi:hypothetical protein
VNSGCLYVGDDTREEKGPSLIILRGGHLATDRQQGSECLCFASWPHGPKYCLCLGTTPTFVHKQKLIK